MTVEDSDGKKSLPVASQFLGPPPAKMKVNDQETTTLDSRRTALENEIARLRQENANQAGRIQQLERTLRILQTRLSDNDK
jgi:predicted RNase H-like nuclease (RuvC/YqgF family)